ncbi:MAG: YqgE/AlgH family protein [Planctomycetaceae bacterium]
MESLSGKLLVASPRLADPHFDRAVVLVLEHGEQGALGLVLNRPGRRQLADIWDEDDHGPCPVERTVAVGGPLDGPLMAIHADPDLAEREVVPGVYFAMRSDLLAALVAAAAEPLHVFTGYAGWGSGQLEGELEAGAWGVADATAEFVFGDGDTLWRRATTHVSDTTLVETLRIRHVPGKPWYN